MGMIRIKKNKQSDEKTLEDIREYVRRKTRIFGKGTSERSKDFMEILENIRYLLEK